MKTEQKINRWASGNTGNPVIVAGQGICGTLVSWFLRKEGIPHLVINGPEIAAASSVAAGLINPVTGRRIVKSWMIDELLPHARQVYREMESFLQTPIITEKPITDYFPNPFQRETFLKKLASGEEGVEYLQLTDKPAAGCFIRHEFGNGRIFPALVTDVRSLVSAYRLRLQEEGCFWDEVFDYSQLKMEGASLRYKELTPELVIFCEGSAAMQNPWFGLLPFAVNKGECLVIAAPGLPREEISKKGILLIPVSGAYGEGERNDLFWVGANYDWDFEDDRPTEKVRDEWLQSLSRILTTTFEPVAHRAALRPSTVDRRPFIGRHPQHPALAIFNGMGTKGCSLAPYFAAELVNHLIHGRPVDPGADISRFRNILLRAK